VHCEWWQLKTATYNLILWALYTLLLAAPDGVSSYGLNEAEQPTSPRADCVPSGGPNIVVAPRQEAPCFGAAPGRGELLSAPPRIRLVPAGASEWFDLARV